MDSIQQQLLSSSSERPVISLLESCGLADDINLLIKYGSLEEFDERVKPNIRKPDEDLSLLTAFTDYSIQRDKLDQLFQYSRMNILIYVLPKDFLSTFYQFRL